MNREIQKRKKRFWAFCLALVFALVQAMPMEVLATGYTVTDQGNNVGTIGDNVILKSGDTITYSINTNRGSATAIQYYDVDGITLLNSNSKNWTDGAATDTYTVAGYNAGSSVPEEQFAGWKTKEIFVSSGLTTRIKFQAVAYTQRTIEYELDGGTYADAANPGTYYEGKEEINLVNPSKENYTFDGWYTDVNFTTKVTAISTDMTGNLKFYAKFSPKEYNINYHNVDGATHTNPATYTYGTGLNGFEEASKTGYAFNGWYSDAELTTPITSILTTQSGTVDVYAKFTPNSYNITYELDGGTNGAGNPNEYTYGTGVTGFADASKTGYTFDGWFSNSSFATQVLSIPGTQVGAVSLYAKYTFIKLAGEGSVSVADVYYGKAPEAVVASSTNGTSAVSIQYKEKGASDATYTSTKPAKVGEYTVRATFAETELYGKLVVTDDFVIQYLDAPASPYNLDGTKGENGYYKSSVTIYPASGYLIADSLDGNYKEKLEITKSSEGFYVYLMNANTGEKTSGIRVSEIKIDNDTPVIQNAVSGETIYGDEAEITITDDNLRQVIVNGEAVKIKDGKAVLKLSSNQGEAEYEIICVDQAGNRSEAKIVVAADWMKTKQIPSGVKVKLFSKYSYTLGSGTWTVSGDSTTYTGGTSFRVKSDGEYTFSNSN